MDEVFTKLQQMLGEAFDQGMAYQRMLDAQTEFNESAERVQKIWLDVRSTLEPSEEEKVN
jgi:hypothetical protein